MQHIIDIDSFMFNTSYDTIPFNTKYILVYFHADSILMGGAELTRVSGAEFNGCRVILGRIDGPILLSAELSGIC